MQSLPLDGVSARACQGVLHLGEEVHGYHYPVAQLCAVFPEGFSPVGARWSSGHGRRCAQCIPRRP